MSTHNLGFHILGFYHRVQWRGAKTAGSECWGPCHGLIPSLWDFAQNCSLQTERWNRNCSGTFHWAMHFGSHGLPKLIEAFPQKQVFFCPCASNGEDSPKASPRAIFKWKRLIEPLKLLSQWMKCGRKLNVNMRQYVSLRAKMGQHCSLSAVQRKTAFVEQSWWPEMFGSMPWCSLTWHKLLPKLAQKNFCTV